MAIKWSAFSAGSAIAAANELVGLQGGANVRWTFTQLNDYFGLYYASNVLQQRNGTNAQALRIYNTISGADSEYLGLTWSGNVLTLQTVQTGTGTDRPIVIRAGAAGFGATLTDSTIQFKNAATSTVLAINETNTTQTAHALFNADNTYDIGASGATRPRTGYFGTSVDVTKATGGTFGNFSNGVNGNFIIAITDSGASAQRAFIGGSVVDVAVQFGPADADTNAAILAQTVRSQGLAAGGTSNQAGKDWTFIASPGKGTGAGGGFLFQVAPAGGSGTTVNTAVTALSIASTGVITSRPALAIPAAASSVSALAFSTTALFGVFFGSGSPNAALTAAKGSLYLRSDGGGVADRAWINTDGATAWTAIATAG